MFKSLLSEVQYEVTVPTVKDRTIQAAMKQIMEPIFEAGFYPTSYGFRPGRSVRGALAHLKALLLPRGMKRWKTEEKPPFQWAVEGDIKGCLERSSHYPQVVDCASKRSG
jgi:retron-type reverse transcriptase